MLTDRVRPVLEALPATRWSSASGVAPAFWPWPAECTPARSSMDIWQGRVLVIEVGTTTA